MNDSDFVKVFDVLDAGYRDWSFAAFGLIFVVIGIVVLFFPSVIKATGLSFLDFKSKWRKGFCYFYIGFALLWTAIAFVSTYSGYHRHHTLAQENKCQVIEGPVENFIPMPYTGHAEESFSVSGVTFNTTVS